MLLGRVLLAIFIVSGCRGCRIQSWLPGQVLVRIFAGAGSRGCQVRHRVDNNDVFDSVGVFEEGGGSREKHQARERETEAERG